MRVWISLVAACFAAALLPDAARAEDLGFTLQLPKGVTPKSAVAVAVAPSLKVETQGTVEGQSVKFEKLLPETPYNVRVTLTDGTVFQGVDLGWYNEEPTEEEPGEFTDEDREQLQDILKLQKFYNKHDLVLLKGDHARAAGLVRLVRDTDFYANKGGEIIWRMEVWYFKNQAGGWEAVSQQNKILRRERFRDKAAFDKDAGATRWVAELGGIVLRPGGDRPTVTLRRESVEASPKG